MIARIKSINILALASLIVFSACEKTDYSFGDIVTPANVVLTTTIAGVDASNPNGNGTGAVDIVTKADNAITYKVDFGDGKTQMVPSGIIKYKYTNPGTFDYTVTVTAIGTAGVTSTLSKKIKVFVAFEIPTEIVQFLTNGSSKTWITDKATDGHFGVGPNDQFAPIWYSATPNSREACAYDDEITFTKVSSSNITINVANKGESFSIGGATAFYGFTGPDGCYPINTGGTKKLGFSNASTGSTAANSTTVQFAVPGNGIVNFGTGATDYEILSITNTQIHLRSIGVTGLAWYMKLKAK